MLTGRLPGHWVLQSIPDAVPLPDSNRLQSSTWAEDRCIKQLQCERIWINFSILSKYSSTNHSIFIHLQPRNYFQKDQWRTYYTGIVSGRWWCRWRIWRSVKTGITFPQLVRVKSKTLINFEHGRWCEMLLKIHYGESRESRTKVLMSCIERGPGRWYWYKIDGLVMKISMQQNELIETKYEV